ncbi:hypothetical protein ACQ4PT_021472 [Festuca glaucescens]
MVATHRSHYIVAMSESTRAPEQRLRPFAGFLEELVSEILLRLPPKSILRCRAVCKDWRRITSDVAFLLAHHRRQPPRRLLSFVRDVGPRRDLDLVDYCVETLDLHTNQLRSVVRFTDSGFSDYDSPFKVYAACDGLLLMSYYARLYLCNPATRQWCSVYPPELQHDTIMGLYAHGCSHSSREYRVLYYRRIGVAPTFYINTVGTENERVIWPETSSESVTKWLRRGPLNLRLDKPCLFSNNLHWPPCSTWLKCLLVFDTVTEVFQWFEGPTELGHMTWLLEMEGTLAISSSNIGGSEVDLWLLQDYKSAIWVHKYRIKLPVLEIRRFDQDVVTETDWCPEFISPEGDVLVDEDGETDADWDSEVVSPEGNVLVDVVNLLLHYDIKGNMLQKFHCDGRMLHFMTHILQESLVPHTFFRMQEDGNVEEPPFFRWL